MFDPLEAQKAELKKIALHDCLTGLPNRALFRELTDAAVVGAARDGSRLALLFIDIDRFEAVNDALGHAASDALLVALAKRLRTAVRASDVVCRHSGDEFIVRLRDADADAWHEVAATADRLLKEMEQPVQFDSHEIAVSASIGVAIYPDDATDPDTLVRHADTAMYAAKKLGRARVSFFSAGLNAQLQVTQQLERELRQALCKTSSSCITSHRSTPAAVRCRAARP
ncbi:MAG: GGDEF domain-containing protein [Microbacteriaceae bacterium]|nr:GGDEF domain-containing protein [Burkholderiaceae bacterium]